MAYVYDNKTYRNLQQQVKENMENIAELQDLKLVGIAVKGIVADYASLPASAEQGQVYAVGSASPYELYVYNNSSWVDFGEFPKAGPQGEQGPQGEPGRQGQRGLTGPQGPRGYTGAPGTPGRPGSDGQAGPKGDKGDKGDPGEPSSIKVNGTIYTSDASGLITLPDYLDEAVWGNIKGTLSSQTDLKNALDAKQDVISDLATIRSGAEAGAKAVQPAGLADYLEKDTFKNINWSHVDTSNSTITHKVSLNLDNEYTLSMARDESSDPTSTEISEYAIQVKSKNESAVLNRGSVLFNTWNGNTLSGTTWLTNDRILIRKGDDPHTDKTILYKDIAKVSQIPTKTSQLTNDSNFSSVSGVNDGTNWTSLTIGSDTYGLGGSGQIGPEGPEGPQGPIGPQGPKGDKGPAGPAGPMGPKGETGATGPKGDTGPIGPQGIQGPKGDKGETGDTGPAGERGPIGPEGPEGPQGPVGPEGPKGDKGDTGERGQQGLQGEIGPQGPKGDKGDTGEQGPEGPMGPQGPKGDIGDPASISVNGTTYTRDSSGLITLPNYPTTTGELTNDSGFITSSALTGYATETWVTNHNYMTAPDVSEAVQMAISNQTKETWTFTLSDGSTVTKTVVLG